MHTKRLPIGYNETHMRFNSIDIGQKSPPVFGVPLRRPEIFRVRKRDSIIVWRCLRDPVRLAVLVKLRLATDGLTDGHTPTAPTELA